MPRLVIEVKKQHKLMEQAFEEMGKQNRWKAMQVKIYMAMYKSKLNGLFALAHSRVKPWIVEETKDYFKAIEEGEPEYIQSQTHKFEKFMLGSEKELKDDIDYQKFKNDKTVNMVLRKMKTGMIGAKDWAMSKALGGGRVIDFFLRVGITVVWKVEDGTC